MRLPAAWSVGWSNVDAQLVSTALNKGTCRLLVFEAEDCLGHSAGCWHEIAKHHMADALLLEPRLMHIVTS